MSIHDLVSALFVAAGLLWLALGGVGLLRFPDFYTRLHPAGKADTFGASLVLIGLVVQAGWSLLALKLLLIEVFIVIANPAATHALGRAAQRSGLAPWTRGEGSR